MVVCKFFLQGTCKFGSYCYNEHQVPSNYNYTSFGSNNQQATSILRQANFGSSQHAKTAPANPNMDINTLVKSVVADMTGAEKGGQWLLSCYAPFKEKPAFPGFEDQSPEEIRLGFYEAQKNGSIDQYKQQLQMLLQNTLVKVRALQNPSPEVVTILQNIYNTPPSSSSGTYGQNTTTTAGNFTQQSNIFATQNKPVFAQQSIFGSQSPTQNIFANAASPSQPQNAFGVNNAGGGFASQQSSNMFTNSAAQSPTSNIFAAPQPFSAPAYGNPQQATNIFASPTQNIFSSSQPPPAFQQQRQSNPMNQNIFATQPQQTMFVSSAPQQPLQQQNLFANSNALPQQPSAAPPSYSASIFGNTANVKPSVGFGVAAQQAFDESLYSKLEELSEEEKRWFESDSLDIHNIPDKPPTYNMCFEV